MTYSLLKQINAVSLKAFRDNDTKAIKPSFCFQIKGVDFPHDTCLINGEWQSITETVKAILNRKLCVTNIRVLANWSKFEKEITYYRDENLNKESNRVMLASDLFWTNEGMREIAKETAEGCEETIKSNDDVFSFFNEYLTMAYEDLCTNMSTEKLGTCLILMRVKTWRGISYGYKIIEPRNWGDILQSYGCDDWAMYLDRYNLNFIGYHHDSNCTPNMGVIRELKPDVKLSEHQLDTLMKKYSQGEAGQLLPRYTRSLKPHFDKVFGW